MAELKTKITTASVEDFIAGVENPKRREDAKVVAALMAEISGEPATMWGPSIIGFGRYHYRYASGHEGDAPVVGFSPRKANLVLYFAGDEPGYSERLARLGKHKAGKACVYVNRLSDLDEAVLRDLIRLTIETTRARYPN
ncbi:DUF1801 domain-containing protein [Brevundimonas sp. TWP2-3-2]|uniref:DUF1801 domain-containing protein n=1 Tax=unclassified Brevundimonas TaxID=2622653 RepID=UPI003CFAD17A